MQRPRDRSSHGTAFRKPNAFTAAVLSVTTKKKQKKKKNWGNGDGVLHEAAAGAGIRSAGSGGGGSYRSAMATWKLAVVEEQDTGME